MGYSLMPKISISLVQLSLSACMGDINECLCFWALGPLMLVSRDSYNVRIKLQAWAFIRYNLVLTGLPVRRDSDIAIAATRLVLHPPRD